MGGTRTCLVREGRERSAETWPVTEKEFNQGRNNLIFCLCEEMLSTDGGIIATIMAAPQKYMGC